MGARVLLTTNIDVSDGLTNGAMGIITDIILDEHNNNIRVILIQFDNCAVGEEVRINSKYKHINISSLPISKVQASAAIHGHTLLPKLTNTISPYACLGSNNS